MKRKKVYLFFGKLGIRTEDHLDELRCACDWAQWSLSRYHILLFQPRVGQDGRVYVELNVPDEVKEPFNTGRHLRGISSYLLTHYPYMKEYRTGNRLLWYVEDTND